MHLSPNQPFYLPELSQEEDEHLFILKPKGELAVDRMILEKVTCWGSSAWGAPKMEPEALEKGN